MGLINSHSEMKKQIIFNTHTSPDYTLPYTTSDKKTKI